MWLTLPRRPAHPEEVSRLKVLSLSTLYPTSADPGAGLFIRSRLQHIAHSADVRVLVPVALLRYSGGKSLWNPAASSHGPWNDGQLEVIFSRWIYPPASGVLAAFCLFFCLVIPVFRLRRKFPFTLIDAHFGHPEGIAASLLATLFRCPFTITLRGSEVEHARFRLRRAGLRFALRRATQVITVSESLRRFVLGFGVPPERVVTIPNGVDASIFSPLDRDVCRRKFNIAPERRIIVSAGHLIELKGHHHIVRALRSLLDRGLDAELLIAGGIGRTPAYDQTIRRLIEELQLTSRVRLLGQVSPPALAELMSAADVFCLASSREGWPNVVHEALSCGTPVVATRVGAVPEMIPSDRYGLVLPAEEVARIHVPLEQALTRSWDRSAISAWGHARAWPQVASEVLARMHAAAGRETS